jgi:hypothetical protein
MTPGSAFSRGMGFPRRLSEEDQERLLAGASVEGHGELDEVAVFMRALPEQVSEAPPEGLERTLVPRLAEAARTSTALAETPAPSPIPERRPRSRFALVARVAVAVALIPALMAGLAVAGVKVPTPAQDAFEGVGVELPNQDEQGDDDSVTKPGNTDTPADDAGTDEGKGKKLGHDKSPAKGGTPPGKKLGHDKSPAKGGTPPGQADGQGNSGSNAEGNGGGSASKQSGSSRGKSSSAPGQTRTRPVPKVKIRGPKK